MVAMSGVHGINGNVFFFPKSLIPRCLFKKWFDNVYGTILIIIIIIIIIIILMIMIWR